MCSHNDSSWATNESPQYHKNLISHGSLGEGLRFYKSKLEKLRGGGGHPFCAHVRPPMVSKTKSLLVLIKHEELYIKIKMSKREKRI
jgi:hypothetical protein